MVNFLFRVSEGISDEIREDLESSRAGVSKALARNLGLDELGASELNVSKVTYADGGKDVTFCEVVLSGISVKDGRRFEAAVGDLETFYGDIIKKHLGEGEKLELRVVIQVDGDLPGTTSNLVESASPIELIGEAA